MPQDAPSTNVRFRALKCLSTYLREQRYRSKIKRCHSNVNIRNDGLDTANLHLAVNALANEVGMVDLERYSCERLDETLFRLTEDTKSSPSPSDLPPTTKEHETIKHTIAELEAFAESNLTRGMPLSPGVTFILLAWAWGLRGEARHRLFEYGKTRISMVNNPITPPMSPEREGGVAMPAGFQPLHMGIPLNLPNKDPYNHHALPTDLQSPPLFFQDLQTHHHTQQTQQPHGNQQFLPNVLNSPPNILSPNTFSSNVHTPTGLLHQNDYFDQHSHQHQRQHSQDIFEQPKTPLRLLSKTNTMPIMSPNSAPPSRIQEPKTRSRPNSRPSSQLSRSRPHSPPHHRHHHRNSSRPLSTRVLLSSPSSPQQSNGGDTYSELSSQCIDDESTSMSGSTVSRTSGVPLVHPSFENQSNIPDFLQQHDRASTIPSRQSETPRGVRTSTPSPATVASVQPRTPEPIMREEPEPVQYVDEDEKEVERLQDEMLPKKIEFVVSPNSSKNVRSPFREPNMNVFEFAVPETPLVSSFNSSETSTVCLKAPAPVRIHKNALPPTPPSEVADSSNEPEDRKLFELPDFDIPERPRTPDNRKIPVEDISDMPELPELAELPVPVASPPVSSVATTTEKPIFKPTVIPVTPTPKPDQAYAPPPVVLTPVELPVASPPNPKPAFDMATLEAFFQSRLQAAMEEMTNTLQSATEKLITAATEKSETEVAELKQQLSAAEQESKERQEALESRVAVLEKKKEELEEKVILEQTKRERATIEAVIRLDKLDIKVAELESNLRDQAEKIEQTRETLLATNNLHIDSTNEAIEQMKSWMKLQAKKTDTALQENAKNCQHHHDFLEGQLSLANHATVSMIGEEAKRILRRFKVGMKKTSTDVDQIVETRVKEKEKDFKELVEDMVKKVQGMEGKIEEVKEFLGEKTVFELQKVSEIGDKLDVIEKGVEEKLEGLEKRLQDVSKKEEDLRETVLDDIETRLEEIEDSRITNIEKDLNDYKSFTTEQFDTFQKHGNLETSEIRALITSFNPQLETIRVKQQSTDAAISSLEHRASDISRAVVESEKRMNAFVEKKLSETGKRSAESDTGIEEKLRQFAQRQRQLEARYGVPFDKKIEQFTAQTDAKIKAIEEELRAETQSFKSSHHDFIQTLQSRVNDFQQQTRDYLTAMGTETTEAIHSTEKALSENIQSTKADIEAHINDLMEAQSHLAELKEAHERKIEHLETLATPITQDIKHLKDRTNTINSSLEAVRTSLTSISTRVETLSKSDNNLSSSVMNLEGDVLKNTDKINRLESLSSTATMSHSHLRDRLERLEQNSAAADRLSRSSTFSLGAVKDSRERGNDSGSEDYRESKKERHGFMGRSRRGTDAGSGTSSNKKSRSGSMRS